MRKESLIEVRSVAVYAAAKRNLYAAVRVISCQISKRNGLASLKMKKLSLIA